MEKEHQSPKYPLVSIIVPVYNVKGFCRKCFDSLLNIDYPQKEIILVDDCSTDGSNEICDKYAETYQEVTVIHHQQNGGVTQARITGVEHAHADIIMFVDSDDYVDPSILLKMQNAMFTYQADIVCCQSYKVFGDSLRVIERSIHGVFVKEGIMHLLSSNLLYDQTLKKAGMATYLCSKLFKKSLLIGSLEKGLGISYGEDTITFLDILINKANSLVCLKETLYYYVKHSSQVTAQPLHVLWPNYVNCWKYMDHIHESPGWSKQLTNRIWYYLKLSIYEDNNKWGKFYNNKFISTFQALRNSEIVKKYLWNNKDIPMQIKRHPHYILLKYRLYWLDYALYSTIWFVIRIKCKWNMCI